MLKFISKFNISAQLIKQLRDISGSPINECKKALESANGDIEKALVKLKEQGFAQAEKRSGNVAKQGVIAALTDSRIAAIAEINCETDFVARTQEFIDFSTNLMRLVLKHRIPVVEDLYKLREQEYFGGLVDEKRKELISKLQENIVVGQLHFLDQEENTIYGVYNHNRLNKSICALAGSVIQLKSNSYISDVGAQVLREGAANLAVQYLAQKPLYMNSSEVPDSIKDQLKEAVKQENPTKTAQQLGFIFKGKFKKYCQENVFLDMDYLLNDEEQSNQMQKIILYYQDILNNQRRHQAQNCRLESIFHYGSDFPIYNFVPDVFSSYSIYLGNIK
ncbi:hypothetical protein pb186bvf_016896 [Paramecium bursaria]